MNILGIDYGRKKIGLAQGDTLTKLAIPLKVLKVASALEAVTKVVDLADELGVGTIVVGLSGKEMADETQVFAATLKEKVSVPLVFVDENFTTQMAQQKALSAGMKAGKRRSLEDAFAAALILQEYFDSLD